MYVLRLFGGVSLEGPSGPLGGRITQRRQLALLTLLAAAHRTGGCSRDKLLAFLWPGAGEERARHLLSDALYVIRKELGEEALLASGQELSLDPGLVSVDVAAFEEAVDEGDLESAVAWYAGPFLDGFHVSGMAELEAWIGAERRRHAARYAEALERLALGAEEENDPRGAVKWWSELGAHDPHSSRVTLRLMEALARVGDHVAAVEVARRHERLLCDDLELEPAPEVMALVERLRERPPSVPAGPERSGGAISTGSSTAAEPDDGESRTPAEIGSSRRRLPGRALVAGGVLAAALAAALLVPGETTTLEPDRIVVDIFANQTGDPALAPVGAMAGHWLVQRLQASGLRVVPFDVSMATIGRGAVGSGAGTGRLADLARASGARIVLSGSYYRDGDVLRLQAEVSDAEKGEILFAPEPVEAPLDSPAAGFDPLVVDVRDFLFRYVNPGTVLDTLPGGIEPPAFDAYRHFLVGMEYFVETDWLTASTHFEEAARLDPTYPAFLYMSAIALLNLGKVRAAGEHLAKLDGLAGRMTPYDRATVDWLTAESRLAALGAARRMAEVGPSYVGYYLVALHTLELNRPAEALEVLDRRDVGSMLGPDWPPYWRVRIEALHSLGRHEEELEAARLAQAQHPGVPFLAGAELPAMAALGRSADVLERGLALFGVGPAGVGPLLEVADELHAHGHPESAEILWTRLAEALRSRVEQDDADRARYAGLVELLERLGRDAEARDVLEALANRDSLLYMEHLGILAARRGAREEAEATLSWLADRPEVEPGGAHLRARARIAAELGDADRALELLRRDLGVSGEYGSVHRDYGLRALRGHPRFRELARPAG